MERQEETAVSTPHTAPLKRSINHKSAPDMLPPANLNPTNSRARDENWPIDVAFVRAHLGTLMDELMPELIQTFFEDGILRLGQLQFSVAGHDGQQIWKTAHSLKGSSATLGMLCLSSLCLQLETAARNEDWETIPSLVDRVGCEFTQIQIALSAS
ncbi:MAG: Hpt domain-containing protein [Chloroflexi bacterium]|nr:Hpt domain-containing protein [Chloroflexota bacterium]MBP7043783.1 Hpt domain-containing protein [Chloroflexota bacterium]